MSKSSGSLSSSTTTLGDSVLFSSTLLAPSAGWLSLLAFIVSSLFFAVLFSLMLINDDGSDACFLHHHISTTCHTSKTMYTLDLIQK
jgi:hypothetical protein